MGKLFGGKVPGWSGGDVRWPGGGVVRWQGGGVARWPGQEIPGRSIPLEVGGVRLPAGDRLCTGRCLL